MTTTPAPMLTADVVEHFGSYTKVADALSLYLGRRVHRFTIYKWGPVVPGLNAAWIEDITGRKHKKLRFDCRAYKNSRRGG